MLSFQNDFFYSQESIENGDLARAHWIQLQKTNTQVLLFVKNIISQKNKFRA